MLYPDGTNYNGGWQNGKMHGLWGLFLSCAMTVIKLLFFMSGYGRYEWSNPEVGQENDGTGDGSVYEGQWRKGMMHGKGR